MAAGDASTISSAGGDPSPYQEYIDRLGSFAKSPLPAYSLAGLFALISPLGFAGGRDRARLPPTVPGRQAIESLLREARERRADPSSSKGGIAGRAISAAAGSSSSSSTTSSKAAGSVANFRALPPFWQLAGFAAAFAGGGYITDCGDHLNGSGTVTAWSLIYLFFHGGNTIRRPAILPATLTCSALAAAVVHGAHYFSRTSWKGALPGLQGSPAKRDAVAR